MGNYLRRAQQWFLGVGLAALSSTVLAQGPTPTGPLPTPSIPPAAVTPVDVPVLSAGSSPWLLMVAFLAFTGLLYLARRRSTNVD